MKIADANIYLRYLLMDNAEQYEIAKKLLKSNDIFLPNEVLCEIVYVLDKTYKTGRTETTNCIAAILQLKNIIFSSREIIANALLLYTNTSLDFVDCLLAGYSKTNGDEILTFDEKLKKRLERI